MIRSRYNRKNIEKYESAPRTGVTSSTTTATLYLIGIESEAIAAEVLSLFARILPHPERNNFFWHSLEYDASHAQGIGIWLRFDPTQGRFGGPESCLTTSEYQIVVVNYSKNSTENVARLLDAVLDAEDGVIAQDALVVPISDGVIDPQCRIWASILTSINSPLALFEVSGQSYRVPFTTNQLKKIQGPRLLQKGHKRVTLSNWKDNELGISGILWKMLQLLIGAILLCFLFVYLVFLFSLTAACDNVFLTDPSTWPIINGVGLQCPR